MNVSIGIRRLIRYGMLALDLENYLINVCSRLEKLIDKCYCSIMLD